MPVVEAMAASQVLGPDRNCLLRVRHLAGGGAETCYCEGGEVSAVSVTIHAFLDQTIRFDRFITA
jgi:hypothetical protein